MYKINDLKVFVFAFVIIQRPIREHLTPIGYHLQPTIRTFNPFISDSVSYICTIQIAGFDI